MLKKLHLIFMSSNDSIISTILLKLMITLEIYQMKRLKKNIHRMLQVFC